MLESVRVLADAVGAGKAPMTQPSTEHAAPTKDTGDTGPRADALPAGQPTRIQNSSAGAVQAPPAPAPATSQGMVADAKIEEPPAPMPAATDAAAAIENLDAQLAELTAELLDPKMGEAPIAQAEPVLAPMAPVVVPIPAPSAPVVEIAPIPKAAPPAAIAPAPVPAVPVQSPLPGPARPIPNRAEAARPGAALLMLAKLSKPLEGRPAVVRTAAGLLAINSLLLAGGVWSFVVLRPAHSAAVEQDYDFASSSLPMPPAEKHAEVKAHEAEAAHGEGGHEGGHDEAAKGKEKKSAKPPAKTEKKAPEKKGAKKPPAKAEEHGHE